MDFETTSITVAYQRRCQDRVQVVPLADRVVIAVADGAGGTSAGEQAAESVIRTVIEAAPHTHDAAAWREVLRQADLRMGAGESTCVVAVRSAAGIVGASVGDSKAWLIHDDRLTDLTSGQVRKPLLGSGEAVPVGFEQPPSPGLLVVCTDGFGNYVRREALLREIRWIDFAVLPRRLVEMVRLPSGELWDDIGIVACQPRKRTSRRRYELTGEDPEPR